MRPHPRSFFTLIHLCPVQLLLSFKAMHCSCPLSCPAGYKRKHTRRAHSCTKFIQQLLYPHCFTVIHY